MDILVKLEEALRIAGMVYQSKSLVKIINLAIQEIKKLQAENEAFRQAMEK